MSLPVLLAQGGGGLGCQARPQGDPVFIDAFNYIFKARESVGGGACNGGLKEFIDLGITHAWVSIAAIVIAIAISVPVGLYLGHKGRGEFAAVSVSNVGRAVPSLALLAFFVAFVGVGYFNVILVLTLLAIPPILTNTFVGVRQVDRDLVAAGRGMGLTEGQLIRQIELPLALPTIFAGLRTSAVAVVATATIAPLANVPTLGRPIVEPQNYGLEGQLAAAIVVLVITVAIDIAFGRGEKIATPKGLTILDREAKAARKRNRATPITPARTES
jgi:osmoprotectant transport system permease protein